MESLNPLLERLGGAKRVMILVIGLAAAGLIFAVAQWASAPTWVPLYVGVPLESVTALTEKLDQAAVKYKLERGGSDIMVSQVDLAKARVALAKGGVPNAGRPGLELFDQPSWGMTDFTQRINYRRALEGELERVIGKMSGIESANVHLVMHETGGFGAEEKPTEASVVLKTKGDADPQVVKGITHLVASSVEGLTSEHVTIVNDGGRLLSEAVEQTAEGLSSRQLSMQRDIEDYLRAKAEKIVAQMVGANNMRVQVSATMSFDRVERVTATVDPEKQVIATEQKAEIVPGAQGGAGQNNTATTYENTRSTENFVAAPGTVKRLTVAVLVADKAPAAGSKAAPAPRTAAEIDQIKMLVRSAIGADSLRGDVVEVVSMAFASTNLPPVEAPKTDLIKVVQTAQRPLLGLVGLVLIIVVMMLSLKSIKGPSAAANNATVMSLPRNDVNGQPMLPPMQPNIPVQLPTNTMRDKVHSTIEQQPDVAARVVRAWLKEA